MQVALAAENEPNREVKQIQHSFSRENTDGFAGPLSANTSCATTEKHLGKCKPH